MEKNPVENVAKNDEIGNISEPKQRIKKCYQRNYGLNGFVKEWNVLICLDASTITAAEGLKNLPIFSIPVLMMQILVSLNSYTMRPKKLSALLKSGATS
jgi:hypothetical protein